ncbi:MAG TPA: acyl-CoA dehydrogenase [Dehalococcoidia bacterium]|nr:acyl-CoA dehydrogenase [Dehalococcoidia bacterium]
MDFALTKEEEFLQKSTREFAEREISPLENQIEQEDKIPDDLILKLGKQGLFGIPVEKKYGGMGGRYLDLVLGVEQVAYVSGAVAFMVAVNYLPVIAIEIAGNEEQKAKFLPALVKGKEKSLGSFSFTEHSTGSDPREIYATAQLEGEHYVCNGHKGFTTGASYDGTIVIFLRTGEGTDVSAFIGQKNTEGYSTPPAYPLIGLRGMTVTDIELKNWRIPAANLLGNRGDGFSILLNTIAVGKVDVAGAMLGIAQRALDEAMKYATEKTMRGRPIGNYQMIQYLIAEMAIDVEAGRYLLYRTMSLMDQKKRTLGSCAVAKLFLAQMADRVTQKAVQVHGGYGYTKDFKVERLYRDAKFGGVVEGSNEIQRVIIARELLKL